MGGGLVFGGFEPFTPPPSPRSRPQVLSYTVILNNQPIELSKNLARHVTNAVAKLSLDPEKAKTLSKELILRADILIGLINETKARLPQENHDLFVSKYHGNDNIEQAFINNKSLWPDEKKWVEETIYNYKRRVELAVSQNTLGPISPPTVNYFSE